jgi:hypothetical protein
MSGRAKKYNIPSEYRGDTWKGMVWRFNRDLTGWRLRMWVVPRGGEDRVLEFDSDSDSVLINPGEDYSYVVWPKMAITIRPGIYDYDAEFINPQGDVGTKVEGTWEILNDKTK